MNSTTGSISGPSGAPMPNAGTPGSATLGNATDRGRLQLHTYIYEYFLKSEQYELARLLSNTLPCRLKASPKASPVKKVPNGEEADEKHKDLLPPDVAHHGDEPFLLAWWGQFWDCFNAARHTESTPARQYMDMIKQQRMANGQRGSINPQMQMNLRNQMMQNGAMTAEMKKAAMSGRPFTASQVRNQHQMLQQAHMNREGSIVDMNGPEGQSPMPGDMISSPKRQRLNDGSFGFPTSAMGPMGQMGRGQPQSMPAPRQFSQAELQHGMLQRNMDPNNPEHQQIFIRQVQQQQQQQQHPQHQQQQQQQRAAAAAAAAQAGMGVGVPNGQTQNSPGMDPNGSMGPQNKQNCALQDYQMQLMLLEQQNKKRLLMARQEQDNATNNGGHPTGPGGPTMAGTTFGQPMSPSGSRTGRSPSTSEDQVKRTGTPQMGNPGIQAGDGTQNFSSPSGGFDANQVASAMNPNMYPQMGKIGGTVGPQGQVMPGATSHPAFNNAQMNGQFHPQVEAMRQQQQARANGAYGHGVPNVPNAGMMTMNQPGQVAPNMTPQQRNAAMPPPPAPGQGDAPRTNPSSPQPFNAVAPPTPQPAAAKAPAKKKEPAKKKAANKKNASAAAATAATPAGSDAGDPAQAPTPAAAPPVTPTAANHNAAKTAAQPAPIAVPAPAVVAPAMAPQSAQGDMMTANAFGLDGTEYGEMDLSFARVGDGNDVLDNFDFDSFLNQNGTDADNSFAFDVNMNFDDGTAGSAGAPGNGPVVETGAAATAADV